MQPARPLKGRQLKNQVRALLAEQDFAAGLTALQQMAPRRVVNPLFSFFYSGDMLLRWRAVSAMGAVVTALAADEMESARVVMRRLLWNLNDESGGIGWGSPEAMGEITARCAPLAREFAPLLVSYARPDGNFLEHPILQRGVLWGLGRLAHARPHVVSDAAACLPPFLGAADSFHRGLAAWAAGALPQPLTRSALMRIVDDPAVFVLYREPRLTEVAVGAVARAALDAARRGPRGVPLDQTSD
ncbi:MAG: DVU0298 family protein [Desulfobacterales bacterium]